MSSVCTPLVGLLKQPRVEQQAEAERRKKMLRTVEKSRSPATLSLILQLHRQSQASSAALFGRNQASHNIYTHHAQK